MTDSTGKVAGTFQIDGQDQVYQGFHYPTSTWNGWANPYLTSKADLLRFLDALAADDLQAGFHAAITVDGDDVLYERVEVDELDGDSTSYGPDSDGHYYVGMGFCWREVRVVEAENAADGVGGVFPR